MRTDAQEREKLDRAIDAVAPRPLWLIDLLWLIAAIAVQLFTMWLTYQFWGEVGLMVWLGICIADINQKIRRRDRDMARRAEAAIRALGKRPYRIADTGHLTK